MEDKASQGHHHHLVAARGFTFDYVPWEQMSKQRRGIMWAMQQARGLDRALLLPPLRFRTSQADVFEYVRFSDLFELASLAAVHPVADLADAVRSVNDGGDGGQPVDLIFSINRGMPKAVLDDQKEWVEGECTSAKVADVECQSSARGHGPCLTHVASFAGVEGGVNVRNLTCGWARTMNWNALLRAPEVRHLRLVAVGGIVYQIPPPKSMVELTAYARARGAKQDVCGWRCPYTHIRAGMTYRRHLVEVASAFLAAVKQQQQQQGQRRQRQRQREREASGRVDPYAFEGASPASVRVLGVHWRRGDFLLRGANSGMEVVCTDEATGVALVGAKKRAGGGTEGCPRASIMLTPAQLASEISEALTLRTASVVFLASNAKQEDIQALEEALPGTPLVRFEASGYSDPELAVLDSLVCALSDVFLGTRRSMFSWNILEERVLQGKEPSTGRLMGLVHPS